MAMFSYNLTFAFLSFLNSMNIPIPVTTKPNLREEHDIVLS